MEIVSFKQDTGPSFWDGKYSKFTKGGAIQRFIEANTPSTTLVFIPICDGFVRDPPEMPRDTTGMNKLNFTKDEPRHQELESVKERAKQKSKRFIQCLLCTRNYSDPSTVLLPFDDEIFEKGLHLQGPPWAHRKSVAFWRGGCSGQPFIRQTVVEALRDQNVKLIKRWHGNRSLSEAHFGNEASIQEYMNHKYILIIDGGVIASSHMWVFGSGSVPILVSHPENNFWFNEWLIPGVNCIHVGYDMNALKGAIKFLVENDDKAQEIAKRAKALADTIFTPKFQQMYLRQKLNPIPYKV
jgi:hypothetical protein